MAGASSVLLNRFPKGLRSETGITEVARGLAWVHVRVPPLPPMWHFLILRTVRETLKSFHHLFLFVLYLIKGMKEGASLVCVKRGVE